MVTAPKPKETHFSQDKWKAKVEEYLTSVKDAQTEAGSVAYATTKAQKEVAELADPLIAIEAEDAAKRAKVALDDLNKKLEIIHEARSAIEGSSEEGQAAVTNAERAAKAALEALGTVKMSQTTVEEQLSLIKAIKNCEEGETGNYWSDGECRMGH